MIACEVCGTDNEPKVTFCRTCGNRLKAKQSRAVAPTPAVGMPKAKLPPRRGNAELSWDLDQAAPAKRSRPSAPPIFFDKSAKPSPVRPPGRSTPAKPAPPRSVDREAARDADADKVRCGQCDALSPKSYRFCISCGAVLGKRSPQQAAGSLARGERRADAPPRQAPQGSSPQPPAAAPAELDCPRCAGSCRAGEAFCKHCGAPLGKVAARAAARQRKDSRTKVPGIGAPPTRSRPPRLVGPGQSDPVELLERLEDGGPFPLVDSAVQEQPPPRRPRSAQPLPPPREGVTGRLVVIIEDGSEGKALELRGRQVDIGGRDGDIVLNEDRYLSPRHARFFRQDDHWYLRDLGSVNGVYRRLREPARLADGDLLLLGLEVLQFALVDHAERGLGHAVEHGVLVFGSPATIRRARLCQRTVEGVVRDVYHLVADETTVGRETGDIVFTSDPFMSRRHASITCDPDTQHYTLSDLGSSNGTYLAITDDVRLVDGDFIRLGQHLFRVDLPDTPRAPSR